MPQPPEGGVLPQMDGMSPWPSQVGAGWGGGAGWDRERWKLGVGDVDRAGSGTLLTKKKKRFQKYENNGNYNGKPLTK